MPPLHQTDKQQKHVSSPVVQEIVDTPESTLDESYIPSTIALCLCMLTHSYLLISVFTYSGYMAVELVASANQENAGSYAGWIASSFMMGRAFTAYGWGQLADRYGRTTALYLSLGLSCVFSILFGIAPNFALAMLFRFCLGAVNGIMGTIKTIVSELCRSNEKWESFMMTTVIGFWGWGFLLSPAIAGALAEPLKQYPSVDWLQQGFLGDALTRYPFLLPNMLGAIFCLLASLTVSLFVKETLPDGQRGNIWSLCGDITRRCRSLKPDVQYSSLPVLKEHNSDRLSLDEDIEHYTSDTSSQKAGAADDQVEKATSMATIWVNKQTRRCLIVYWLYSFAGLTVDEVFPLFCMSREAGFGLSEIGIGKVLSLCGLIFAFSQYFVSTCIYKCYGLNGSIRMGTSLSAPIMFLIPISVLLNQGADEGELKKTTFGFLSVMIALNRVFALVFFSSISVAINRSVSQSQRATTNGIGMLGGSVAKGLGPIFAGQLVARSVSWFGSYGSLFIFGTIGIFGCSVSLMTFFLLQDDVEEPGDAIVDDFASVSDDERKVVEMVRKQAK